MKTIHIKTYLGSPVTQCGMYANDYDHSNNKYWNPKFDGYVIAVNPQDKTLATCKRCIKSQNREDNK